MLEDELPHKSVVSWISPGNIFYTTQKVLSSRKTARFQLPSCTSYQKCACSGRCKVKLGFYLLFGIFIITFIALIATVNSTILLQLLSSSGEKVVPVRHDPPVQQQQGEPTNSFADVCLAGGWIFCLFSFFLFVVSLAGGFIFWHFFNSLFCQFGK